MVITKLPKDMAHGRIRTFFAAQTNCKGRHARNTYSVANAIVYGLDESKIQSFRGQKNKFNLCVVLHKSRFSYI